MLFLIFALSMSLGFFVYVAQSFIIFLRTGVSSNSSHYTDILELLKKYNLQKGDVLYDLGSGDGRFLFHALHNTECAAVGYELSFIKHRIAKFASRILRVRKRVTLHRKNLLKADLSNATAIFCSLSPKMLKRVKIKFEKELQSETKIISETYPIPGIAAEEIITLKGLKKKKYYLYTFYKDTF